MHSVYSCHASLAAFPPRLAEKGLPPNTAEDQINYRLRDWVKWGGDYWAESLDDMLAPIIQRHRERLEAEEKARLRAERTKLLDDRCAERVGQRG